jgi:hypothetical protein
MIMPANPFDFTGATRMDDIFNRKTTEVFDQLQQQGVPVNKAVDLFYDALEAPGVSESVRRDVADHIEPLVATRAANNIRSLFQSGWSKQEILQRLNKVTLEKADQKMREDIQDWSQSAIRIARIKGATTDPLVRAIAREVETLSEAERDSLGGMVGAFLRAYEQINPPATVSNPFDFRNAQNRRDIEKEAYHVYQQLKAEGVSKEAATNLYYDALEADGVDSQLRQEVVDYNELKAAFYLKTTFTELVRNGGIASLESQHPVVTQFWLENVQNLAYQAISLSKINGISVDPILHDVAREVSALSSAERDSVGSMALALTKAFEQAEKPSVRPRAKPKHIEL